MVEALTIVLAMGVTRGWRSALIGAVAATVALAAIVAALGPALTLIPIEVLRLVVGALLLVFGLQWLRKAILRASGWRSLRDEDSVFARETGAGEAATHEERAGLDWYGFTVSFKGVLLEGLEVAFIVLTFGSTQGSIPLAAAGATAAAQPRAREHARVRRGRDAHDVRHVLGRRGRRSRLAGWRRVAAGRARVRRPRVACLRHSAAPEAARLRMRRFAQFWWDFIVGDDWRLAIGVLATVGVVVVLADHGANPWWLLPPAILGLLAASVSVAARRPGDGR